MFDELEKIDQRPAPFEFYTAEDLWTDEHTSEQMLGYHLDEAVDVSSRNATFITRSVEWIKSRFALSRDSAVADFGCGPGWYTTALARCGAQVNGIDFSERSIRHARNIATREGLSINYVQQNYLDFTTDERFDLVLMIMCDYCALSPQQRYRLLGIFYNILKPGGAILLDVYSLAAFAAKKECSLYEKNQLNGFWSANSYYGFLNTFKYPAEKVILDKYTIIEKNRVRTVYNWLQYFSADMLQQEFAQAGLKVREFYADVAGGEYRPEPDSVRRGSVGSFRPVVSGRHPRNSARRREKKSPEHRGYRTPATRSPRLRTG